MEKKIKIILIVIIALLIMLVLGLGGYIIYDKMLNEKDNENINTTTTTASIKENIIHTDTFTYNINNKNKKVKFVYIKESGDEFNHDFETEEDINIAKENGEYVYNAIYLRMYINDIEVETEKKLIYLNLDSEINDFTNYYKKTDLFKFNGEDKEYFVFVTEEPNKYVDSLTIPIVFNDEGKLLYKINFTGNFGITVVDKNSRFYGQEEMYLIENNAVYFVELVCGIPYDSDADEEDVHNEVIQERILTIDNDVVNITPGKIYKGAGGGAIPSYCPQE